MSKFEKLMILWDIQESINKNAIRITKKNRHLIINLERKDESR